MERDLPGPAALAIELANAGDDAARSVLLEQRAGVDRVALAHALKEVYLASSSSEPARAARAAAALTSLAERSGNLETRALSRWTAGMAPLQLEGQMERAVALLDEAAGFFERIGTPHAAAQTQVAKVAALAMLGRYDEAIECGLRARDVFIAHADELAAGKIEQNIGSIHQRLDQYQEAERYARAARARFLVTGDQKQLAQVENNLATALKWRHEFRDAATLYESALGRAAVEGLEVTQAEIEVNLGVLALFQGHFERALDYLERSRRRYVALGMAHKSALTELDLADAYLELNLAPEAASIYARVIPIFADSGLRAEQARALAHLARAALLLGQARQAREYLEQATSLYAAEGNVVGAAMVTLIEAQLLHAEGDDAGAATLAAQAEGPLATAGAWGRLLLARWLRGEAPRRLGDVELARSLFQGTLRDAEAQVVPQVAQRCHTSLGLLSAATGDREAAEIAFRRAVTLIEGMREPLPAEEFRTAFVADKLVPYTELVRLHLADGSPEGIVEALGYVERARSRALVEMLAGAVTSRPEPRDAFETELLARLDELREDLNWFYSQMERAPMGDVSRGVSPLMALQDAIRDRETAVLEISRQMQQRGGSATVDVEPLDVSELRRALGRETALVEYFSLDGEVLAFIVTDGGVEVLRPLCREIDAERAIGQLRFQIDTMRYGASRLRPHVPQLATRARHYLGLLYDLLLRPIERRLGTRRLVVVPHRALHYIPFQALHDGQGYVVERREVSYAPSATVLRHCLARPTRPLRRLTILSVPDAQTPCVRDEVAAVAPLFPQAVTLLDDRATLAALREHLPGADVLHLACHGQFRPDNPLFSSLRLGDGWLTVRDAYDLDLSRCSLVALSACETGVSAVAPGDELIGLARGFFSAGSPSLLVSLWTVDDDTTARLMTAFYHRLLAGDGPAAALRHAQRSLLADEAHPFFWSPFVVLGRW
ncbi:MAG: CHAT domain-containing tetratricopeptide repeat protein [Chloroflexota bacterium]|nr:CHAT domain-containing tetratricopeptide repeat protein [Chloroflexota bacterium]